MRILFQYLTGGGGGLANIMLLLQTLSKLYPSDHIDIVCAPSSDLNSLETLPNVEIAPYGAGRHQEVDRALLGFGGLGRMAEKRKIDVIWSLNFGAYLRSFVPQVLSINNAHQVYPWQVARYHPSNQLHVAVLRWFFRKSLRVSAGVIVQTPLMGELVKKIAGAPPRIQVVPKAVENDQDVLPEPLPSDLERILHTSSGKRFFTFLYVATSFPHKNHKLLLRVFKRLAREGTPARLVVTLGAEELLAIGGGDVRQLIESGHLVPVGWVKKACLKALYDACDACLMPSLLESLSSAHLEAMQWGKPQISSDLRSFRELCGNAALYVLADDAAGWATRIDEVISDANLRRDLVTAGYERMKQFPATWTEVAGKVHSFLEEIVSVDNAK